VTFPDYNEVINYPIYYVLIFLGQAAVYIFIVFKLDLRRNIIKEEPSLNEIDDDLAEVEEEV